MEEVTQHKITKIKLGITHGDINSISYEIILKAFKDPRIFEFFTPILYGSPKIAAYYKKVAKLTQIQLNHIKTPEQADPKTLNVINCIDAKARVEIGQPTEISGKAAIDALKAAVQDLKQGKIDALVTAPISKAAVYGENFNFKGHTWYLAKEFGAQDVLMLMVHDDLRIAVVTDHIPIKEVSSTLTEELILDKIRIMEQSLKTDFRIEKPLIAVLGLNPHAGDYGIIGDEEEKIIKPAIEKAKEQGYNVIGPYPADGFFASGNYKNFDGILAMYHDQGLIPFKILSKGQGVNYTAGLPVIRTSPDHGTAYDIAGLNQADPTSFSNAIFLARDIYKNRQLFADIKPLEKQNMEDLMYTLMPAKSSDLQEIENLQKEDAQDNIQKPEQQKKQEKTTQTQTKQAPTENTEQTQQKQEEPIKEQQEKEEQTESKKAQVPQHEAQTEIEEVEIEEIDIEQEDTQDILLGDHPDVELETVDEIEENEIEEDEHEQKQHNAHHHKHNGNNELNKFKPKKKLFIPHHNEYKEMT